MFSHEPPSVSWRPLTAASWATIIVAVIGFAALSLTNITTIVSTSRRELRARDQQNQHEERMKLRDQEHEERTRLTVQKHEAYSRLLAEVRAAKQRQEKEFETQVRERSNSVTFYAVELNAAVAQAKLVSSSNGQTAIRTIMREFLVGHYEKTGAAEDALQNVFVNELHLSPLPDTRTPLI